MFVVKIVDNRRIIGYQIIKVWPGCQYKAFFIQVLLFDIFQCFIRFQQMLQHHCQYDCAGFWNVRVSLVINRTNGSPDAVFLQAVYRIRGRVDAHQVCKALFFQIF